MKIGFDGKRAVQNFTGLGNYSRYVADILCRYYPNNDYILYTPRKQENKRLDVLIKQHNQLHLCFPTITFWKWSISRRFTPPALAGIRCRRLQM